MRAANSRLCVTTTKVMPRLRFSSSNRFTTSSPVLPSRLPVGSSASRTLGSSSVARAMAARWRSPPDNVVTL